MSAGKTIIALGKVLDAIETCKREWPSRDLGTNDRDCLSPEDVAEDDVAEAEISIRRAIGVVSRGGGVRD